MQSPPARAEATRVMILSPTLARPGARPQVQVPVDQLGQAQLQDQGGRKNQPGIVDQSVVVKGDLDAVKKVAW